jgi:hypothetical protein
MKSISICSFWCLALECILFVTTFIILKRNIAEMPPSYTWTLKQELCFYYMKKDAALIFFFLLAAVKWCYTFYFMSKLPGCVIFRYSPTTPPDDLLRPFWRSKESIRVTMTSEHLESMLQQTPLKPPKLLPLNQCILCQ